MERKITHIILCALLILSCSRTDIEYPETGHVTKSFFISTSEMLMEGPGNMDGLETKATTPLDPSVENTIKNLWVLQYDSDGILVYQHYFPQTNPVLSVQLQEVELIEGNDCTIVIIANMGGINGSDPDWPSDDSFKWAEHKGGNLHALRSKILAYSMKNLIPEHLIMTGIAQIDVDDDDAYITVMLARLACKFKVSIKSNTENYYKNVSIKMVNCPSQIYFFPQEIDGINMEDYDQQTVCGESEYLGTDKYLNFWFYANENLDSESDRQTALCITAKDKDGQSLTKTVPVSSHGTTYRNTCYNIQVSLK